MNRAERRRQAREQEKAQGQDSDPCPNGHPEQAQAWMLHGTPPIRCPRCGETPQFGGQVMTNMVDPVEYGMPERVTRQWVVANSIKDELGTVSMGEEGAYAVFYPECDHDPDEGCDCRENPDVMWRFEEEEYR